MVAVFLVLIVIVVVVVVDVVVAKKQTLSDWTRVTKFLCNDNVLGYSLKAII